MTGIDDASERFARLVLQSYGGDVHDALRAVAQLRADIRRLEDAVTARAVELEWAKRTPGQPPT
jgi:hypothetical protein